ncbi:MAG: Pathogenesis-related transcriptional factor and ERF protein [Caulobacteraceae bacterium]|nr:Pathogenesis-related transcriptional factor and ERF protein [Caulobacteraceae bacterium]
MKKPKYEEVAKILDYNPKTGKFFRKINTGSFGRIGEVLGYTTKRGYRKTSVCNIQLYDHQLAWLLFYSKWPDRQIDHINGNRSDNRISNLREATVSQNALNRSYQSNSKTKYKCINWKPDRKKYRVKIGVNKKYYHIGYFVNLDEAIKARDIAIKKLHGEFAKV